jgi:recombination protein RecT
MAGPRTDATGQIVRKNGGGLAAGGDLAALVGSLKNEIARALPRHLNADRMARIVTTALRTTPKLGECTPASFAGCVMSLAQLGLEPNTPLQHAYLIPRENRKRGIVECTLIIGYQGMIELARRSGQIDDIYAEVVYPGDHFHWQRGTDPRVDHVPSLADDRTAGKLTHVYGVAFIRGAARQGAGSSYSPWATDYTAMARKSAVRALWKFLPKSAEMARLEAVESAMDDGKAIAVALEPEVADVLQAKNLLDTTADEPLELLPAEAPADVREPGEEGEE